MFRFLRVLFAGSLCLLTFSCTGLFLEDQKPNTAQNNFDLLWKIIDERYCFFEEKNVDWDRMYDKHWRNWQGTDPASPHLFHAMAEMLEELRDGHVTLDDGFNARSYSGWYANFPDNFDLRRINLYRNPDRRAGNYFNNNGTTFTVLPEAIGYIRCPSFSEKFNRNDLDNEFARLEGLRGVIIDIRNNGGGLVSEAYLLASKFARDRTCVGYVRYKTGKGHNDFSDFFARYIEPEGKNQFHGNVVVLTNRRVYSAANLFVSSMAAMPQVHVMGDNTGGGGGIPISAELYNGWTVKFSTNPVFDINKNSIEQGIAPHRRIALNNDTQRDNIIEAAKTWILAR